MILRKWHWNIGSIVIFVEELHKSQIEMVQVVRVNWCVADNDDLYRLRLSGMKTKFAQMHKNGKVQSVQKLEKN